MDDYDDDSDGAEYVEDDETSDYEEDSTQEESEYSDGDVEYVDDEEEGTTVEEGSDDTAINLEQSDHSDDDTEEDSEDEEYTDVETEICDDDDDDGELIYDEEQESHTGDTTEHSEDESTETEYSDVDEEDDLEDEEYYDDEEDEYCEDDEYLPMPSRASSSKPAVPKAMSVPKAKPRNSETFKLLSLSPRDDDYSYVSEKMHKSIATHSTMQFTKYKIIKIEKVWNTKVYSRYKHREQHIREETDNEPNVTMLFHGSPKSREIVKRGFDERHASMDGMFGAGVYFAQHSSKSNQYAFGLNTGCGPHGQVDCQHCTRLMMLCRVVLGNVYTRTSAQSFAHAPPGHHSVKGSTSAGNLRYPEYIVYRGEQAFPEFLITYKIVK